MRMMMKVQLDTEAGSRAIADGSMPQLMQETLGRLQPEAAYFGPENGIRTASSCSTSRTRPSFPRLPSRCSAR
jgi:hypothetical protein